jgi:hypothetical protein
MAQATMTSAAFEGLLLESPRLLPEAYRDGSVSYMQSGDVVTFTLKNAKRRAFATITATQQPSTDWLLDGPQEILSLI